MSDAQPRKRQVNIEIPSDLGATYANFAMITHSASEIVIDFARVLPKAPNPKVHARIVTTPMHAKMLLRALQDNLQKYEARFGEINLPSEGEALAQQFFGGVRPPRSPEE